MGERLYRTQILLEPLQHSRLRALSRRTKRSASELVREAIAAYLAREEEKSRAAVAAVGQLEQVRQSLMEARNGGLLLLDIPELIRQMREERADDLVRKASRD
mgnify:CR=1 FL=1